MKAAIPVLMVVAGCVMAATAPAAAQKIVREQPKPNFSISGADNYRQYCAPCHGVDGKGDGPAAPALKMPPSDLTLIAQRNNGRFPEDKVHSIIVGEATLPAHGSREMPVWGPIFRHISGENLSVVDMRVRNLLGYLKNMQTHP